MTEPDEIDWEAVSVVTTGSAAYADWCQLSARDQLAALVGECQCCNSTNRPPAPAIAIWTARLSGNRRLLCRACLGSYQANAAVYSDLAGIPEYLPGEAP